MVDLNDQYMQLLDLVARQHGGTPPTDLPYSTALGAGAQPSAPTSSAPVAFPQQGAPVPQQPAPQALADPYAGPSPPPNTGPAGAPYGAYRQEGHPWTQLQFDPQGQFVGLSGYRRPDSPIPAAPPQQAQAQPAPYSGPTQNIYDVNPAGYGGGRPYGSYAPPAQSQGGGLTPPVPPRPVSLEEARAAVLSQSAGNPRALQLADAFAPEMKRRMDSERALQFQQQNEAYKNQVSGQNLASNVSHRQAIEQHFGSLENTQQQKVGLDQQRVQDRQIAAQELVYNNAMRNVNDAYLKIQDAGFRKKYVEQEMKRADEAAAKLRKLRGEDQQGGAQEQLPEAAKKLLREGQIATFNNGQEWTLEGGVPKRIK